MEDYIPFTVVELVRGGKRRKCIIQLLQFADGKPLKTTGRIIWMSI